MIPLFFMCLAAHAIDGDTLTCGTTRVRLAVIDAPEIHGCRRSRVCTPGDGRASKASLATMVEGRTIACIDSDASPRRGFQRYDPYGRRVATCYNSAVDVGAEQVRRGMAVERYRW